MRTSRILGSVLAPFSLGAGALTILLTLSAFTMPAAASGGIAQASAAGAHSAPMIHLKDGKNSTSTNWSGYASTGTTYSSVAGSWTQPSASCASGETSYSSFWVGIDGDTTSSVEQTGTDADCSSGTPTYYAWYEMYPKYPVNLSNTVRPGDHLTASVTVSGSGTFTLKISDSTQGWSYSTNQKSTRAKRGSAEWIAEAPSSSGGVLPLTNFGTVSFSNCTANGTAISSNPNVDEIVMETSSGTVKAQPSSLSGGNAFSVAWKHS